VIALDTNVLVRFLLEDEAEQYRRVIALVRRATEAGDQLYVSDVVLAELVWVLRLRYNFQKSEVIDKLQLLLQARQLTFASTDRVAGAIRSFAAGKGDFADYLIREQALEDDCAAVATFDRALLKEPGFIAP
jgi:predicted nucleic-acid-binding protein